MEEDLVDGLFHRAETRLWIPRAHERNDGGLHVHCSLLTVMLRD